MGRFYHCISLKIRLLNKENIKLESSSQVSNKKEENIYPESNNTLLEDMGPASSFTKTQVKIETVFSTIKGICDLENHHDQEANERSFCLTACRASAPWR